MTPQGALQSRSLFFGKHAHGTTNFHTEFINTFHHIDYAIKIAVIANLAPGSAHAKTR